MKFCLEILTIAQGTDDFDDDFGGDKDHHLDKSIFYVFLLLHSKAKLAI